MKSEGSNAMRGESPEYCLSMGSHGRKSEVVEVAPAAVSKAMCWSPLELPSSRFSSFPARISLPAGLCRSRPAEETREVPGGAPVPLLPTAPALSIPHQLAFLQTALPNSLPPIPA